MAGQLERVQKAQTRALELHQQQLRKGTQTPYITHLWAVAALVGEFGGDEEQIIAAFLHDAIEDQGDKISLQDIREQFGNRAAEIVEGCTETQTKPKLPWKERKRLYLDHLRTSPPQVKLVAAADKLHNARALMQGSCTEGRAVWSRFNAGRDDQLWYYRAAVDALRQGWRHPILDELERVVNEMELLPGLS